MGTIFLSYIRILGTNKNCLHTRAYVDIIADKVPQFMTSGYLYTGGHFYQYNAQCHKSNISRDLFTGYNNEFYVVFTVTKSYCLRAILGFVE